MKRIARRDGESKRKRVLGRVEVMGAEEYEGLEVNAKVELIRSLIPLGLMAVEGMLEEEVKELAGERYSREGGEVDVRRHGRNPGSVRLGGQRVGMWVPRVRNSRTQREVGLKTWGALRSQGELNEGLLRGVLLGLSCRNYGKAAESVPGALGLSSSSVSREYIQASEGRLREFRERDLGGYDLVGMVLDGKTFAEDRMVVGLGVTLEGEKVMLGFVQTGTENERVVRGFLNELLGRGLRIEEGLLVVIDGSKGLRSAVREAFGEKAAVQRCQWHKRENVVSYLPKGEQWSWRRRLQMAYEKGSYREAKESLEKVRGELMERNESAAKSLEEGLEETLTLHRLGVFPYVGRSLKTTNCLESVLSQVERMCGKVTCWKNSSQKHRWLAASLLEIEPRLRKISGHQHLAQLRYALQRELGIKIERNVA